MRKFWSISGIGRTITFNRSKRCVPNRNDSRSYRAVYVVKDKKFVQLADETMESVTLSNDGRHRSRQQTTALYRVTSDYDPGLTDFYLVNTADGTRKQIAPEATVRRFDFRRARSIRSTLTARIGTRIRLPMAASVNLTKTLGVNFFNEDNDTPELPNAYGVAGWTKDDRDVLIYDRFDVWQVSPDGSGAKNLTDGVGRRDHDPVSLCAAGSEKNDRSIRPSRCCCTPRTKTRATRVSIATKSMAACPRSF